MTNDKFNFTQAKVSISDRKVASNLSSRPNYSKGQIHLDE